MGSEERRLQAWQSGHDAYSKGLPEEACTRQRGTIFFDDWHDGYEAARAADMSKNPPNLSPSDKPVKETAESDHDAREPGLGERPPWMIALVDMVETVTIESLMQEPGEPIWRIEIDGYCVDFDYSEAANNFANAINEKVCALIDSQSAEIARLEQDIAEQSDYQHKAVATLTAATFMDQRPMPEHFQR